MDKLKLYNFLFIIFISANAQNSISKDSFFGNWSLCWNSGYMVQLDSNFNCDSKSTIEFFSDGTFLGYFKNFNQQPVNGKWNYFDGKLSIEKENIHDKSDLSDTMEINMISPDRLYSKEYKFRVFENGNKKSYPCYTYFIRIK
jgi:hypothetical protein